MSDAISPIADSTAAADAPPDSPGSDRRRHETESRVAEISSLLSALEEAAAESGMTPSPAPSSPGAPAPTSPRPPAVRPKSSDDPEIRLVQVRLGLASSLFTALKLRHPPTASHSLRVALGCSTWALYKRLDDDTRDVVELAALLHEVGKISAPDALLAKNGPLSAAEQQQLDAHWQASVSILSCCCSSKRVLAAVEYAGVRFDGHGAGEWQPTGDRLPLEARMIAIVDAFDAMTSAPPGQPARTRDAALAELRADGGARFDSVLVKQFIELLSHDHEALTAQVAGHWYNELGKRQCDLPWQPQATIVAPSRDASAESGPSLFEQQLIDSMHDGVIFVDGHAQIFLWSKGAERLTGVSAAAASGRHFVPGLLDMCNTAGRRIRDEACPVARALANGAQLRQRLEILGRQGGHVAIDLHAIPVHDGDGNLQGATVVLHDAEPEASLEEKCEALHAEVTKDPMTKVANRAEFDRMQALFIEAHQQAGLPCSLIMSDIDHFKHINDTYGHQAGDEAIITVANLLKGMCRSGDLVARYGGEEFALLCADCGLADAASRAEQIRRKLSETPHAALGNKRITASFGVAQLQAGDTPETMLRRADQGLLMAKDRGRNQVVQMGERMQEPLKRRKWWNFGSLRPQPIVEATLTTDVPVDIAIQKLRGFVTDQKAKILATRENHIEMELTGEAVGYSRRRADRPDPFRVEIDFSERRVERTNNIGLAAGQYALSVAKVTIRPRRNRNRRSGDQADRARLVLQSLKAYLMAREVDAEGAAELAATK